MVNTRPDSRHRSPAASRSAGCAFCLRSASRHRAGSESIRRDLMVLVSPSKRTERHTSTRGAAAASRPSRRRQAPATLPHVLPHLGARTLFVLVGGPHPSRPRPFGWLRPTLTGGLRHHCGQACRREEMTNQSLICGLGKPSRLPDNDRARGCTRPEAAEPCLSVSGRPLRGRAEFTSKRSHWFVPSIAHPSDATFGRTARPERRTSCRPHPPRGQHPPNDHTQDSRRLAAPRY